eukprot:sb/3468283/
MERCYKYSYQFYSKRIALLTVLHVVQAVLPEDFKHAPKFYNDAWNTAKNYWNTDNYSPWNSSIADPYGSGTGRGFATGNYTPDGLQNPFSELLARHPTEMLRHPPSPPSWWSPGTIFPSPSSDFNSNHTGIFWAPVGNSSDPPGLQWITIVSSGPAILICLLTSIILGVIILRQGMDAIKVLYSVLCYVFSMVFLTPNSNPHFFSSGVSNADNRGLLVPGTQSNQAEIGDKLQAQGDHPEHRPDPPLLLHCHDNSSPGYIRVETP